VALEAQARVDEDLRYRVLRGVALLEVVGAGQVRDVVDRMVEADVLERVGYALNEIVLLNDGHNLLSLRLKAGSELKEMMVSVYEAMLKGPSE
jgi:hypothetical protein